MTAKAARKQSPPSSLLSRAVGLDLRSLAAFRIAIALFVLYDLATRAVDLSAHYSDAGALPRNWVVPYFSILPAYRDWNWSGLSVHMLSGSALVIGLIFALHALAAIAMMVGYRTRLATFIVWFLMCSLHTRNPLVLSVGDEVLRVLLFFALFLPLSSRVKGSYASPATAAYYLQFIAIYFFSALLKSGPEWRTDGTAVYYAFNFDQFALGFAKTLLNYPQLLKVLSLAIWWLELLGAFILLIPNPFAKLAGIVLLAGLQIGIGTTLAIGHNPWANLIALIPFIPALGKSATAARVEKHWWAEAIATFFIVGVLIYNAAWIVPLNSIKSMVELPVLAARLEQYWGMFAPAPSKDDGWYVVEGRLTRGATVEAFRRERDVHYEKPATAAGFYPNERWRRYIMNVGTRDYREFRLPFSQYVCREWNLTNAGPDHLEQVRLVFMRETTLPPGQEPKVENLLFYEYSCLP